MGFPTGDRFNGTPDQLVKIEQQFLRKASFMQERKVVAWNGEFGPVYSDPTVDADAGEINQERYNLLDAQLAVYDKYQISWSIWLYKDIEVQGMVYTDPEGPWMKTIQPFLEKKKRYQLDAWGKYPSKEIDDLFAPLAKFIDTACPEATNTYPTTWPTRTHLARNVIETFMAQAFSMEFANLFKDMSKDQLDELLQSFKFSQCKQREGLNKIMSDHAALHKKQADV